MVSPDEGAFATDRYGPTERVVLDAVIGGELDLLGSDRRNGLGQRRVAGRMDRVGVYGQVPRPAGELASAGIARMTRTRSDRSRRCIDTRFE